MNSNSAFEILYDFPNNFIISEKRTKKQNNKYIRFEFKDFHPKKNLTPAQSWYKDTNRNGTSFIFLFHNKNSLFLTTFDYTYYKVLKGKKRSEFRQKQWEKAPWKLRYSPGRESLTIKLIKNGELRFLAKSKLGKRKGKICYHISGNKINKYIKTFYYSLHNTNFYYIDNYKLKNRIEKVNKQLFVNKVKSEINLFLKLKESKIRI